MFYRHRSHSQAYLVAIGESNIAEPHTSNVVFHSPQVAKWKHAMDVECHIRITSFSQTFDLDPNVNSFVPIFLSQPARLLDFGASLVLDPSVNPPL
jgi:hypothetical protein